MWTARKNLSRRAVSVLVLFAVVTLLISCGAELVLENPFDPAADNSPLGAEITGMYSFGYFDPVLSEDRATLGWDRIDDATAYEYQIVDVYASTADFESPSFDPFDDVDAGSLSPRDSGTVAQTTDEFSNPTVDTAVISGPDAYAFRVRYSAVVTNNGVTADAFSPWSGSFVSITGTFSDPFTDWTYYSGNGDWYYGYFDDRGEQRSYLFEPFGFAGSLFTLSIDDEFSGMAPGADTIVYLYDYANLGAGVAFQFDDNYDKVASPYTITIPPSEQVLIVIESDNPGYTEFGIRIDY